MTERKPTPLTPNQSADVIRYYYDNANRESRENDWGDAVSLTQVAIETTLESSSLLPPDVHGNIRPMLTEGEKSIGEDRIENPSAPLKSRRYYKKLLELIDKEQYSYEAALEMLERGEV